MSGAGGAERIDEPGDDGLRWGGLRRDDGDGMAGEVSLRLAIGPNGPVVVKRARGGAVALVLREAEVLGRVRHPGLVEFVGCREREGATELITAHAGSATLAQHSPSSAATIAWLGAGIASTLADLHAAGFAHTHLCPDHVVLDGSGRTVLCSLGRAQEATAATVRTDLDDLLVLLTGLMDRLPDRRFGMRRTQRALEVALAAGREPAVTMARVASLLAAIPGVEPPVSVPSAAPDASLPGTSRLGNRKNPYALVSVSVPRSGIGAEADPTREPAGDAQPLMAQHDDIAAGSATRTWRDRVRPEPGLATAAAPRRLLVRLALVAMIAGCLTAGGLLVMRSDAPPPRADRSEGKAPMDAAAAPATVTGAASPPPTGSGSAGLRPSMATDCRAAAPSAACAGDVELFGGVVRVGAEWYVLAGYRDADVAFVGDWDCDGLVTPAVYRAASGQVFEFGDWSGARPLVWATVEGDRAPDSRVQIVEAEGCDALARRTASGDTQPLVAR